tara:strand:- start:259 stop:429 length:171 start_codon:yes stop_codon:yes gene_type:complete
MILIIIIKRFQYEFIFLHSHHHTGPGGVCFLLLCRCGGIFYYQAIKDTSPTILQGQ